jgi:hypothetical protein
MRFQISETLTIVKNNPPKQSETLTISKTNQKIMQRGIDISRSEGFEVSRNKHSGFQDI